MGIELWRWDLILYGKVIPGTPAETLNMKENRAKFTDVSTALKNQVGSLPDEYIDSLTTILNINPLAALYNLKLLYGFDPNKHLHEIAREICPSESMSLAFRDLEEFSIRAKLTKLQRNAPTSEEGPAYADYIRNIATLTQAASENHHSRLRKLRRTSGIWRGY